MTAVSNSTGPWIWIHNANELQRKKIWTKVAPQGNNDQSGISGDSEHNDRLLI